MTAPEPDDARVREIARLISPMAWQREGTRSYEGRIEASKEKARAILAYLTANPPAPTRADGAPDVSAEDNEIINGLHEKLKASVASTVDDEPVAGLKKSRAALIEAGFSDAGPDGDGDPEVTAITTAIRFLNSARRMDKLRDFGLHDAAHFVASASAPAQDVSGLVKHLDRMIAIASRNESGPEIQAAREALAQYRAEGGEER